MTARTRMLSSHRRIVVKIGSSLLVDKQTGLKAAWLESVADDVAALARTGADVVLVSSGSIALGRSVLRLPSGSLKLEESQAAASVGQIALAGTYADVLSKRGLTAAQILLTVGDTEERQNYLNARATISKLLDLKAVPVINENDTVATTEIRYGDNDRLAARVASMMSADVLVLLSDIEGLYTAPPHQDPSAQLIPEVHKITAEIESMAGAAASELSRGGMVTKIEAAKIALSSGCHMVIASGHPLHPLRAIDAGAKCTWFVASATPVAARKKWIAGSLEPRGTLTIDAGAVKALQSGRSLLAAGVTLVDGIFQRGDTVVVRGPDGSEVGRGLVGFDSDQTRQISGKNSEEMAQILGEDIESELIHRDDLVVG